MPLPRLHWRAEQLLLGIDLVGTALFAAEGASTAMAAHLDLLGILVLAAVTSLGGGIVRDLLIADTPPPAIRDWRYPALCFVTGVLMFLLHPTFSGRELSLITVLDAAGLSFFAIAGAAKAIEFKLHPLLAVIMGGLTGVGGGTLRDLLINRIPTILQSDIYAAAALFGALVLILALRLRLRPALASTLGIVACFVLRMLAVHYGWNLPGASTLRSV